MNAGDEYTKSNPYVAISYDTDEKLFVRIRAAGGKMGDRWRTFLDAISGARYDDKRRLHLVPVNRLSNILTRLRREGFDVRVAPPVLDELSRLDAKQWLDLQAVKSRLSVVERQILEIGRKKGKDLHLRDYQRYGAEWLSVRSGMLLDEMGLGKSLQALVAAPAQAPIVVISPASVKGVWAREAGLWRPGLKVTVLEGRGSFRWPEPGELVSINYDILPPVHKEDCPRVFKKECPGCSPFQPGSHRPDCDRGKTYCPGCTPLPAAPEGVILIGDEFHVVKNKRAKRSESVRALAKAVREKKGLTWGLTATPVLNRPEELWNILDALDLAYEAFGSWKSFVELFGGQPKIIERVKANGVRVKEQKGWEWTGQTSPEAAERIQRVCLRRMRRDVLKDLPPKSYDVIPVEIDKRTLKECDAFVKVIGGLADLGKLLAAKKLPFELVSKVRAALATAKIPAMMEQVEEYEEAQECLVVFSAHRKPIDMLAQREGWAVITGDTPPSERTKIEERFQEGKYRGLAATIAAGGVGITLTYAAHSLFVDREWTPALNAQAEDRLLRHGQERAVLIKVLVANHKLDERVEEILQGKAELIAASVDASSAR